MEILEKLLFHVSGSAMDMEWRPIVRQNRVGTVHFLTLAEGLWSHYTTPGTLVHPLSEKAGVLFLVLRLLLS